jgi:3-dehydroquinate synthase
MKKLHVPLGERSYDLLIGDGILSEPLTAATKFASVAERVALVCDETVWGLYGQPVSDSLRVAGLSSEPILVPPGEGSKSIARLSYLYERFAEMGLTRGGLVVALGGGVTGDLAGFAAATWMRGVNLVQIPTTLLAQVDSSVGGKTAIDIGAGKNLVGSFHQPRLVVIDPETLKTLPPREYAAGMAEVIKYGAIASPSLFEKLELRQLELKPPGDDIADIICECCRIKRDVVAEDEFDTGRRMMLNFGHTFGHAIETKYGYNKYNHGEAVAGGMRLAARVGEALGVTEAGTEERLSRLLSRYGLDVREGADGLLSIMKRDKKAAGSGVNLVLLKNIGEATVEYVEYTALETAGVV